MGCKSKCSLALSLTEAESGAGLAASRCLGCRVTPGRSLASGRYAWRPRCEMASIAREARIMLQTINLQSEQTFINGPGKEGRGGMRREEDNDGGEKGIDEVILQIPFSR